MLMRYNPTSHCIQFPCPKPSHPTHPSSTQLNPRQPSNSHHFFKKPFKYIGLARELKPPLNQAKLHNDMSLLLNGYHICHKQLETLTKGIGVLDYSGKTILFYIYCNLFYSLLKLVIVIKTIRSFP